MKTAPYTAILDDGTAIAFNIRSRPTTQVERRAIRWFWFDLQRDDGSRELYRKQFSWHKAVDYGDLLAAKTKDLDILFLIDGNVPRALFEQQRVFVPTPCIWNQWRLTAFTDDGKPCVMVNVKQSLAYQLLGAL